MSQESQEMLKILQNLNDAQNSPTPAVDSTGQAVPSGISQDAAEMYNILAKLHKVQDATDSAASNIVTETIKQPVHDSVGIDRFNIVLEKRDVSGFTKTYYTIAENGKVVYDGLALFESAMAIIKNKLFKDDVGKTTAIIDYDTRYAKALEEAASQKRRQKTLNESVELDVSAAKHSVAADKMQKMKKAIKQLL